MSGENNVREVIGGKWEVLGPLDRGGMGDLFEVRHVSLGLLAVLKRIRWDQPPSGDAIARLTREGQFAGRFQNNHTVVIYDAGQDGGPYLVFERLRGESVAARLRRGTLPLQEAAVSIVQLLDALACVHAQGVVHRDVKPGNVFLARDDAGRVRTKLIDFGIARLSAEAPTGAADIDVTRSGDLIGTERYASPEQFRNASEVDGRADLWATAVTLFCMLTGDAPWSKEAWRLAMSAGEPLVVPSVTSLRPELPAALDGFFAKALAPDIASRFLTAKEMSDVLVALVPEAARAVSPGVADVPPEGAPVAAAVPHPARFEGADSIVPNVLPPAPRHHPWSRRGGVAAALFAAAFLLARSCMPGAPSDAPNPALPNDGGAPSALTSPPDAGAPDVAVASSVDVLPSTDDVATDRGRAPSPTGRSSNHARPTVVGPDIRPPVAPAQDAGPVPVSVEVVSPQPPSAPDASPQSDPPARVVVPCDDAPERCRRVCPNDPCNCPGCGGS